MPVPQSEIDEAVNLVGSSLDSQKNNLDVIYQFSFKNSIKKLPPLVTALQQSAEGTDQYRNAVNNLNDWLQSAPANDDSHFSKTLKLRELIFDVLEHRDNSHSAHIVPIAQWIVSIWGGVDRLRAGKAASASQLSAAQADREARYLQLIRIAENWDKESRLALEGYSRIAYWSKYLAFRHPTTAAIFDSRVAYSLNWYLKDARHAKCFPLLPTENRLLSLLDHAAIIAGQRVGWQEFERLVHEDIEQIELGKKSGIRGIIKKRCEVPESEAYSYYLRILDGVSKQLFEECPWRLVKTEMLLFGIATTRIAEEVIAMLRAERV